MYSKNHGEPESYTKETSLYIATEKKKKTEIIRRIRENMVEMNVGQRRLLC